MTSKCVRCGSGMVEVEEVRICPFDGYRSDYAPDMLVSIIIPTFNHARFIKESIESSLAQTYPNIEVIIVDDGSTDNMLEIVERYPQIKYIRQSNQGVATAMNNGIKASHGDFFVCLAADDKLHPRYVELCLKTILKDSNIGFVWTATQEFGDAHNVRAPNVLNHRFSVYHNFGGQLGAALTRRAAFKAVGEFDQTLPAVEDWDWAIRAYKKGWKGKAIYTPLHYYRIHNGQHSELAVKQACRCMEQKYPIMRLLRWIYWAFDRSAELLKTPNKFKARLERKCRRFVSYRNVHPDDVWESHRLDERLFFGLDIGSGKNKLLPLGCDFRKVSDVQCSATHLPFRDKAFVIAVFRHSLEHVSNWCKALNEAERVASEVFVFLPKKEVWDLDKSHIPMLELEGEAIRDFELANCFKVIA